MAQYCSSFSPITSTVGHRKLTSSSLFMPPKKPVKRQTSSLFDDLDDEPAHLEPTPSADALPSFVELVGERPTEAATFVERVRPEIASGEKGKARDIIAAIKLLKDIDARLTPATPEERAILARFPGFGPVALSIFPNPATGEFKPGWEEIGQELKELLTDEEYASAKRTTFNAFYTSPTVIDAMHQALQHLGVPENALVLEPGCGPGRMLAIAPEGMRFLGVELDRITGRITKTLYPQHDIRVQDFNDTQLPPIDAVIGNVPFADLKLDHKGQKFALHDYFFAKSVDSLKPGGVLALVTSHYTLDKQNAAIREYLADKADFLGAIRLRPRRIDRSPPVPAVEELTSLCGGVADSFEKGTELLQKTAGIRLSEATVQRTTEATGRRIAELLVKGRTIGGKQPWSWFRDALGQTVGYIGIDATGFDSRDRTAERLRGGWRMSG